MSALDIAAADPFERQRMDVLDSSIAYVDVGEGSPIIFLHGNPTSSYLWRNIIPHVSAKHRCLAPDLIGMGDSGKSPNGAYRFADHSRYIDAWIEALTLHEGITFVIHDWGSALGFDWAYRHPEQVHALVYMEALVQSLSWNMWPDDATKVFRALRSSAGEAMVLEKNVFVERILPGSVLRSLSNEEMDHYRRPFVKPGESRRPTLSWPREIPLDGEPADVAAIVDAYADWLKGSNVPKLFINANPGAILIGEQREFCRSWPNQTEITVAGSHFIQEDSPHDIGAAVARFLRGVEQNTLGP